MKYFALAAAVVGLAAPTAQPPVGVPPIVIDGYVWNWLPASPSYFPATGYEHNSSGGAIQIVRSAVGTYQVRFVGMAGTGGIAHASAYGNNNICTVVSYFPSGGNEIVNVRCFSPAGAPVDSRFLANVTNQKPTNTAYVWNDDPTPAAAGHTPPATWSYDSAGQPIVVYRSGVGHYQVELGAFAADYPASWASGYLRATAYGSSARHCQIVDPDYVDDPELVNLWCFDDTGFGVDTRFTLTYSRALTSASATVNLEAAPALDGWSNAYGGAPTTTEPGQYQYEVSIPGAAGELGHAIASIMGTPPMYCNTYNWTSVGGAKVVRIRCYDGGNGDPNPAVMLNVGFRTA